MNLIPSLPKENACLTFVSILFLSSQTQSIYEWLSLYLQNELKNCFFLIAIWTFYKTMTCILQNCQV